MSLLLAAGGGVPSFILMNATQFTLGDTDEFDWTGNSVDPNSLDGNIRTSLTFIAEGQDFDFKATFVSATGNGPVLGFYDNGTGDEARKPSTSDDIIYTSNDSAAVGWAHDNDNVDGSKTSNWVQNSTIQLSRRGSTYYGLIDGVLDHTYTEVTGNSAGGFFIGNGGATHAWSADDVQYRLGPGLPAIS